MFRRFLAVLAAMLVLSIAFATPVSAAPNVDQGGQIVSMCDQASTGSANSYAGDFLPMNRWGDSGSVQSRRGWSINPAEWAKLATDSNIQGTLGMGNALWRMSSATTEGAIRMCVAEQVGRSLDKALAAVSSAIFQSGLIALAVFFALLSLLWRSRTQGRFDFAAIGKTVVVVAVMAMFSFGAANTTDTKFGVGSPGWWGKQVDTSIRAVSDAPISAVSQAVSSITFSTVQGSSPEQIAAVDRTHCAAFTKVLENDYRFWYNSFGSSAMAPVSINTLWKASSFASFKLIQFGSNPYADRAACHGLELQSRKVEPGGGTGAIAELGKVPKAGSHINEAASLSFTPNPEALAFNAHGDLRYYDMAMVGWAACKITGAEGSIAVDAGFGAIGDGKGITEEDCLAFFTKPASDDANKKFDFGDNNEEIAKLLADHPDVRAYMMALHGQELGSATATAIGFFLSSLAVSIVFLILSVSVYLAKIGLHLMAFFAFFLLIVAVFRSGEDENKLITVVKQYLMLAFFAVAASLLLTAVAVISAGIQGLAQSMFAPGSIEASVWVGLSPLAAVLLLHYFITKVLKAPSPFKPTTAMAWGAAAGGTAGFALGRSNVGRAAGRVGSMATRAGSRLAMDRLGLRRTGGMLPRSSRSGQMLGAAGLGAAAGAGAAAGSHLANDLLDDHDEQTTSAPGVPAAATPGSATPSRAERRDQLQAAKDEAEKAVDFQRRDGTDLGEWEDSKLVRKLANTGHRLESARDSVRHGFESVRSAAQDPGAALARARDFAARRALQAGSDLVNHPLRSAGSVLKGAARIGGKSVKGALALGAVGAVGAFGAPAIAAAGVAWMGARGVSNVTHRLRHGSWRGDPRNQADAIAAYRQHQQAAVAGQARSAGGGVAPAVAGSAPVVSLAAPMTHGRQRTVPSSPQTPTLPDLEPRRPGSARRMVFADEPASSWRPPDFEEFAPLQPPPYPGSVLQPPPHPGSVLPP